MSELHIVPLLEYLQKIKVVGPASDTSSATVVSRGYNSLILRYLPFGHRIPDYFTIVRSSRQYYRVDAFLYDAEGTILNGQVIHKRYRSHILVADFIRALI